MIISGLDTETTGLDVEKGHRLIEVAVSMWDYTPSQPPRKKGKTWVQRIKPDRSIDPAAEAVHHISFADLRHEPDWPSVAPTIRKLLQASDLVVAHNMAFDLTFLVHEFDRIGIERPSFIPFCTMENGRSCTPMGTLPNLAKLCWAMDIEYDATVAHAADYDTDVMMDAYFEGLQRGLFEIPVQITSAMAA